MAYLLSTGDDRMFPDPSPETIAELIEALPGGDASFLTLARDDDDLTYMQAIGSPAEGFTLEYQDGSVERHFQCVLNPLPTEHVVLALQAYRRGDAVWKTALTWQPLEL